MRPCAASASPKRQRRRPPGSRVRRRPSPPADSRGDGADGRLPDPTGFNRSIAGASRSVRRAFLSAFRRRLVVRARRFDGDSRGRGRHAARERARREPRGRRPGRQGDRRRSFAGRPRGRLDDDAARRRQALGRHSRRQLPDAQFNRRRARRDRRSHGGDRPAARTRSRSSRWASARTGTAPPPATARREARGDRRKASEGGDSNDAWSRRGAGRDRSF